jgi:hypothetical protein
MSSQHQPNNGLNHPVESTNRNLFKGGENVRLSSARISSFCSEINWNIV